MKITKLFKKILEEQIANKKLFNGLMAKWREENPELSEEMGEKIFLKFQQIKNGLNPKLPQVNSFLSRFDGNFGYDTFNPDYLKDITKYTYKQIKSLIDEYTPLDELVEYEDADVFDPKDTTPTPEKIEASKDLWFGDRYCIINTDGFRVYDIPDQSVSVKFGYYLEVINKTYSGANAPWCVTWRSDQGYTNRWENYRSTDYQRSFYFVIDESKSPDYETNREINRYYLCALQISPLVTTKYIMTSIKNDGDNSKTWSEVINIYPKLANFKELIKIKPFSKDELQQQSLMSKISEAPGQFEFRRQEKNVKKAFINGNAILKKPESWKSMDGELKSLYISLTNKTNAFPRFGNYAFLNEIKKVGSDFTLLNNRLKALGLESGVGEIYSELIKTDFKTSRISKETSNIILFQSKTDGSFGIFSKEFGNWYRKGGTTYEPIYKRIKMTTMKDEKNVPYIVETYSQHSTPDEKSFYALFPHSEMQSARAYFLTAEAYTKLLEKMSEEEIKGKKVTTMTGFEPGIDIDIKENKRGDN